MMYFVNYTITKSYRGKLTIDAFSSKEAERKVSILGNSFLIESAVDSDTKTSFSPQPFDPKQLDFLSTLQDTEM